MLNVIVMGTPTRPTSGANTSRSQLSACGDQQSPPPSSSCTERRVITVATTAPAPSVVGVPITPPGRWRASGGIALGRGGSTFELMAATAPMKVVLNEAVELAKKFGSEDSARFVNGVLDKLAHLAGLAKAP